MKSTDPADYPTNWEQLAEFVCLDRAGARCECMGECGVVHSFAVSKMGTRPTVEITEGPDEEGVLPPSDRCPKMHGDMLIADSTEGNRTVQLVAVHLCLDTKCDDLLHVKAMCQGCRLRLNVLADQGKLDLQTGGY